MLYFHRVDARLDEVFEARVALEQLVAGLATDRIDESDLLRLRALVDAEASGDSKDHRALHSLLASMTRNPALELFVDMLNRVTLLYFSTGNTLATATLNESAHAHERIADAVIAGDDGLAQRRMRTHLEAEGAFLRRRRSASQVLDASVAMAGPAGNKGAERVARSIFRDTVERDLPPGTLLGSETELTEAHGVSRAVFREAVRILEHHQIATMRRGPGGGLFVSPPSAVAVTEVVAIYLARSGVSVENLTEVRLGVELALIDLVIDRMSDEHADKLPRSARADEAESAPVNTAHDLHATIASLAGNHALELVELVLIRLTRLHQVERKPGSRSGIKRDVYPRTKRSSPRSSTATGSWPGTACAATSPPSPRT